MAYFDKARRFRDRIHTPGCRLAGCWVALDSATNAEIMAEAGLDFLLVDAEHGMLPVPRIRDLIRRLVTRDTAVLIRLRDKRPGEIGAMLDMGVDGFVFPKVESREEAEQLVAATQFAPRGTRGLAISSVPASRYGFDADDYHRHADDGVTIFCQIESRAGVAEAGAIASVPRLDGLFIGPNDLSAELGHFRDYTAPAFTDAVVHVEQAAQDAGKRLAGIPHGTTGTNDLLGRGYALVPASSDLKFLRDGVASLIRTMRTE